MERSDFQHVNLVVVLLERALARPAPIEANLVREAMKLRETLVESLGIVDELLADPSEDASATTLRAVPRRLELQAKAENLEESIIRVERLLIGLSARRELQQVFEVEAQAISP